MFIAQQQKFFRACFSRAESVFNRVFGNKLNPFYHLGTIAFWQFWLVFGRWSASPMTSGGWVASCVRYTATPPTA